MSAVSPVAFDPVEHRYTLGGIPVPSVTQVLRTVGYITFDGIPAKVLEAARDRGQRVHQALHFLHEDDLDESTVDDVTRGYLDSARTYLAKHFRQVHRAEMRVWSLRHGCAGTLDILGVHMDGRLCVADFKTGDPADVAADLQIAAYLGFLLEMGSADPELGAELRAHGTLIRRRSIRLFKTGREARETLYTDVRDYGRFLNALSVVHDVAKRPSPSLAWDDER